MKVKDLVVKSGIVLFQVVVIPVVVAAAYLYILISKDKVKNPSN